MGLSRKNDGEDTQSICVTFMQSKVRVVLLRKTDKKMRQFTRNKGNV